MTQTLVLKAESSLSYYDRYVLWMLFGSMRKDQVNAVDLLSTNVLNARQFLGRELTYTADIIKMDALIRNFFLMLSIKRTQSDCGGEHHNRGTFGNTCGARSHTHGCGCGEYPTSFAAFGSHKT